MANIRKSFNFRNGVQVDNDNFVVNANGLVGIGTSIPTQFLDVYGNNSGAVQVQGLTTTTTLGVGETSTFYGDVKVGSAITMDPTSGIITATAFYGDGSTLSNVFAVAVQGWTQQGVGLHTFRPVGLGTTNPLYALQIGEDPSIGIGVGITDGNIIVSGVVTASSFVGSLTGTATTATNLSDGANITTGTISNDRLPNVITSNINSSSGVSTFTILKVGTGITMSGGIITATTFDGSFVGSLTGTATTATKLEIARNFSITGDLEASSISFDGSSDVSLVSVLSSSFSANTSGIITANTFSGILTSTNVYGTSGTFDDLRVNKTTAASIVVTSATSSSVSIGESVGAGNSSAQFIYTPGAGRLDINNYDVGGVSINLHEGTGTGTTESFNVKYDNTKQFEVTYDGKVGVNRGATPLTRNFEVGGDMFVSNNAKVSGIMTIGTGAFEITLGDGSAIPIPDTQNFNTISGISTFNELVISNNLNVGQGVTVASTGFFGGEVGIGTTSNVGFLTGPNGLKGHVEGSIWAKNGFYTAGKVVITKKPDGSVLTDDRIIPSSPIDYGAIVPFVEYGDFQVESGSASFVSDNLLIVPSVGQATVGFGTTNGGLIPLNFLPGGNRYLSKIGINTYYSRGLVDIGVGSTTMNSYVLLPSLNQTDLDIVANLWNSPANTGYAAANKVTPDGLPDGALVHNASTNTIQVGHGTDSFRNLSPVVAFATVDSGSLVSTDGYNLLLSNSTTNANFTFSNALQSANYTVMVSFGSTTESYTVPEAEKLTTGFRITFNPSNASTQSYSVMILQI